MLFRFTGSRAGGDSSCGRLWCCSCRVVCCVVVVLFWSCVVLLLLCVRVCDLFLFLQVQEKHHITHTKGRTRSEGARAGSKPPPIFYCLCTYVGGVRLEVWGVVIVVCVCVGVLFSVGVCV